MGDYREAGVRVVWVVDPSTRRATVYRSLLDVQAIDESGVLDAGGVVPGFSVPPADLLAD